ncbi:hypothetical protein ACT7C8_02305 [Bacillus cereus]
MAKKDKHFKRKAVMMYINGEKSYQILSNELGIRSAIQLKDWVKKHKQGEPLADQRGENPENSIPFIVYLKQHLQVSRKKEII